MLPRKKPSGSNTLKSKKQSLRRRVVKRDSSVGKFIERHLKKKGHKGDGTDDTGPSYK